MIDNDGYSAICSNQKKSVCFHIMNCADKYRQGNIFQRATKNSQWTEYWTDDENEEKKTPNNSGIIINSSPFIVNPLNMLIPWSETHRYINSLRATERWQRCVHNHGNAIKTFLLLTFIFIALQRPFIRHPKSLVEWLWMEAKWYGASKICFINKTCTVNCLPGNKTQDFCLFYLLSSKQYYLFCYFFMYSYERARAIIANKKYVNMIFQKKRIQKKTSKNENCFPLDIHIKHFRTYLLSYISFIGLFLFAYIEWT